MKIIYTLLLFFSFSILHGQAIVDFEDVFIEQDSFLNGSDQSGGFAFENIFLPNEYNPDFMSWSGWALTNETDNTTPGFFNQYASISGGGHNSDNYATTFVLGQSMIDVSLTFPNTDFVGGLMVNNSTYAYFSMLEGDAFAKKFGGETGNDPDFFLLTIKAMFQGNISTDSINFYLADYRFEDNSLDYIVDEWTNIDLKPLGLADQIIFTLSSSDVGQFGMNTPAYFCIDDIEIEFSSSNDDLEIDHSIQLSPNPITDQIWITGENPITYLEVYNMEGKSLLIEKGTHLNYLDASHLQSGSYILKSISQGKQQITRFIKI